MVNYSDSHLNTVFSALADPTRRGILAQLVQGQSAITALQTPHKMSLPGVMKHVRVLEEAGLVRQQKTGRVVHCQLVAAPMEEAASWIQEYREFWDKRLDSLTDYLVSNKDKGD